MSEEYLTSSTELSMGKLMALIAAQALVFSAFGALLWKWTGRDLPDLITFDRNEVISGLLLGVGMSLAAALLFIGWRRVGDKLVLLQQESLALMPGKMPGPAVIWISLCAGLGEEVLFRGGIQIFLSDYVGSAISVFLAASLFAASHASKPIIAVFLLIIGMIFGTVFSYTGSLIVVIIGHTIYDVFALWYAHKRLQELTDSSNRSIVSSL